VVPEMVRMGASDPSSDSRLLETAPPALAARNLLLLLLLLLLEVVMDGNGCKPGAEAVERLTPGSEQTGPWLGPASPAEPHAA